MNNLPSEIIILIFQNLDQRQLYKCIFINRQFYAIINPLLWCQLNIRNVASLSSSCNKSTRLLTNTLASYPSLGEHIQHVHFCSYLTDTEFLTFIKYTDHLKELMIDEATYLTESSFQQMERFCPQLESLYLHDGHGNLFCLLEHPLDSICQLELNHCTDLDGDLFSSFPLLTDLTMTDCHFLNNDQHDVEIILSGLHRLTRLILSQPNDMSAYLVPKHDHCWPHLTEFHLDPCLTITDTQTITFIKDHPHLLHLTLSNANHLTDKTLEMIAMYLPHIKIIGLDGNPQWTSQGIRRLIRSCHALEKLQLLDCDISTMDFPEAKIGCWKIENSHGDPFFLKHIDKLAIHQIQSNEQYTMVK